MSNRLVSVIIVTAGRAGYLERTIESVERQTQAAGEIIIVDNSLDEVFGAALVGHHPHLVVLPSPKNLFYCQALNTGIKKAKGEWVLCLNDDVILDERFLEEALRGFRISPRVGMVSGKILRLDQKTIDSTGLFLSPWRTARERGYGVLDRGQYEREGYVFGVNGAVALYRREMLEDIKGEGGYFDEAYHIFYEDLDIAWRAQNALWKGYYIPAAVAYHARGATVRRKEGIAKPFGRTYLSSELHLDLIKNRYLTVLKNESFLGLLLHAPLIALYDCCAWGLTLFCNPRIIPVFFKNADLLRSAIRRRIAGF